ncbi:MAG: D-inositol-3-phosphate glycosyltransferase [Gammaproteobacteria bacterium]|nr:D-inositol-3-phosphate glycosyltransferase [Gammaproteobacteria bacterium]
MHICFLCNEYPPTPHGGIGTMTQILARALVLRGHRVSVVGIYGRNETNNKSHVENDRGVTVYRIPASPIPATGYIVNGWRLRRTLQEIGHDNFIDVLDGPENGFSLIAKSFPSVKIIRMSGGHHFFSVTLGKKTRVWRSWLERQSFRKADHFCAVSQFAANTTKRLLKMPDMPVEIIPNPVDIRLFSPEADVLEQKDLIVFSGTVCEKKGVRQLVDAFVKVSTVFPDANLVINGKDSIEPETKGSYIEYLRRKIPPHLLSKIHFNGHVALEYLPKIYSKAAVLVFPSHMETQGMVVTEGMAMGKVVIASKTGPGTELIDDGVNGLLCDPFDPASIAERIIYALSNAALRRKLGMAAREKIEREFSVDILVKKNLDFYKKCLMTVCKT